jgi:hypothetical protein
MQNLERPPGFYGEWKKRISKPTYNMIPFIHHFRNKNKFLRVSRLMVTRKQVRDLQEVRSGIDFKRETCGLGTVF